MGCPCPGEQCDCPEESTPGVGSQQHPVGDLVSGGTGMSMRRFKAQRTAGRKLDTSGQPDWGTAAAYNQGGWAGFNRPLQNLDQQWDKVEMPAPAVGFHVQRTYIDADTGDAVSLMGDPCSDGHLYPTDPSAGYEFAAGNI